MDFADTLQHTPVYGQAGRRLHFVSKVTLNRQENKRKGIAADEIIFSAGEKRHSYGVIPRRWFHAFLFSIRPLYRGVPNGKA